MQSIKEKQVRKCIVTNQRFKKAEMIRIVSFQGGKIEIDLTGKKPGRGCYVSLDINNLEKLVERKGALLARAFKKSISEAEIAYLKTEFAKAVEEKKFRPRISKPVVLRIKRNQLPK